MKQKIWLQQKKPIHTEQTRMPKVINEKPKNIIKNFIDLAGKHATTERSL